MTATDELRKMLDERGVEYEVERINLSNYSTWGENDCYSYTEYPDGTVLRIWDCTPEQAIAATLGRGTCKWELVKHGPLYDVFECSVCSYEYSESRTDNGATDFYPNYCPNCGRKVVSE